MPKAYADPIEVATHQHGRPEVTASKDRPPRAYLAYSGAVGTATCGQVDRIMWVCVWV